MRNYRPQMSAVLSEFTDITAITHILCHGSLLVLVSL